MREILFRGKRFSNGEWVVGGIIKTFHPNYDCKNEEDFFSQTPNCCCICANNKDYFVEQDSIGQYTGLTDKNGKKIFEGDVINIEYLDTIVNNAVVRYVGAEFYGDNDFDLWELDEYVSIEVIGNIHDTPELLKGERK